METVTITDDTTTASNTPDTHWGYPGGGTKTATTYSRTETVTFNSSDGWPKVIVVPPQVRAKPVRRRGPLVRRNGPCPCGSGNKFKACCLRS